MRPNAQGALARSILRPVLLSGIVTVNGPLSSSPGMVNSRFPLILRLYQNYTTCQVSPGNIKTAQWLQIHSVIILGLTKKVTRGSPRV